MGSGATVGWRFLSERGSNCLNVVQGWGLGGQPLRTALSHHKYKSPEPFL